MEPLSPGPGKLPLPTQGGLPDICLHSLLCVPPQCLVPTLEGRKTDGRNRWSHRWPSASASGPMGSGSSSPQPAAERCTGFREGEGPETHSPSEQTGDRHATLQQTKTRKHSTSHTNTGVTEEKEGGRDTALGTERSPPEFHTTEEFGKNSDSVQRDRAGPLRQRRRKCLL